MDVRTYLKLIVPGKLRDRLQPARLRNYRNQRAFKRSHPRVEIIQPSAVVDCTFGDFIRIEKNCWAYRCAFGSHTYVADNSTLAHCDIGKFCSIASRTHVGMAQHPTRDFVSTHPAFYRAEPAAMLLYADRDYFDGWVKTTIGHDVWIGSAAQVRGGVTIGNGAIIGAGAVVTADVPAYSIVVGVPAKVLRYRFDEDTIAFLQRFHWWNRDEAWLAENYKKFHDIKAFRSEFDTVLRSVFNAGV